MEKNDSLGLNAVWWHARHAYNSTYMFVRMKMIWKYALKLYDGEPYDVRNKLQTNGMLVVAIDA